MDSRWVFEVEQGCSCEVGLDSWQQLPGYLTEGEETPLTEYNEVVQRLQRKRGMVSIAEQAKNFLQPLSEPATATAPRSTTPPVENPTVIPVGDDLQDSEDMLVEKSAG